MRFGSMAAAVTLTILTGSPAGGGYAVTTSITRANRHLTE